MTALLASPAPALPDTSTDNQPLAEPLEPTIPADPLQQIVQRMSSALHDLEVDGVTRDPRTLQPATEEIRLSVVPQLLGYVELYRVKPIQSYYQDIVDRADFLVANFRGITSGSAFDGMLGYALLGAWEITGNPRYRDAAQPIVDQCKRLSGSSNTLNWGLMSCLALSKYYALTGDPAALQKTHQILATLPVYQNTDGSFPHYCYGSEDVHYTGWMAMELTIVRRHVTNPLIDVMLGKMLAFLKGRIGPDGVTSYQEACGPGCWRYYYGYASGCYQDYDTRAWVNELGYSALLLDHFRDGQYHDVMRFLNQLENDGLVADKWDYFPPPWDPLYPWVGNPSVVRTSVVFWSMASIRADRESPIPARYPAPAPGPLAGPAYFDLGEDGVVWPAESLLVVLRQAGEVGIPPAPEVADDAISPRDYHPSPEMENAAPAGAAGLRVEWVGSAGNGPVVRLSLATAAPVEVEVFDIGGRLVHDAGRRWLGPGSHEIGWDGRDRAGTRVGPAIYFLRLRAAGAVATARVVIGL